MVEIINMENETFSDISGYEAMHISYWPSDNLITIGEVIGIECSLVEEKKAVESFSVDVSSEYENDTLMIIDIDKKFREPYYKFPLSQRKNSLD